MIEEDYVSFEIAKLLKDKGFDEKCQKVYLHNSKLLWAQVFMEGESFVNNECINLVANYNDWMTYIQGDYAYLCPTLQMAMKYLRKKHKLCIVSIPVVTDDDGDGGCLWKYVISRKLKPLYESESLYESPETALNKAIQYCLENLI